MKQPPQAIEIEEAVIGALLIESSAIHKVISIISNPDIFYKEKNQLIFTAILTLFDTGQKVDLRTVSNALGEKGLNQVGGNYALMQMTMNIHSSANIETHCRILQEKFFAREIIKVTAEIINKAYESDSDPFKLMDILYGKFTELNNSLNTRQVKRIQELVIENIANIEKARNSTNRVTGIDTGFTKINFYTSGWQRTDLIILAARPGMGKSALAFQMALTQAKNGMNVAFFSLEMGANQLVMRGQSLEAEVELEKMRNGSVMSEEINKLCDTAKNLYLDNFTIVDDASMTVSKMRAKLNGIKDIDLVYVDYLQLMEGKGDNKNSQIEYISRNLKVIAKDFNVPVIALSQLSRGVESRADKRPMLSDLRDSGAIEQDADIVCFLYRPGYYDQAENFGSSELCEFIIAKQRNGRTGTIQLGFINRFTKFEDN